MSDFDTIRAALQLHIRGAASLNDWKMASDALSRVEAAAEQTEKTLAFVLGHDGRLQPVWQLGAGQNWQEWSDAKNKVRAARAALAVLRDKDTR